MSKSGAACSASLPSNLRTILRKTDLPLLPVTVAYQQHLFPNVAGQRVAYGALNEPDQVGISRENLNRNRSHSGAAVSGL